MIKSIIVALCPRCHAPLQETPATAFDEVATKGVAVRGKAFDTKPRETVIAACTGCEFAVDLRRPDGVQKSSQELLVEVGQWLAQNP